MEPILSLAFAMHSNRGVYAVLLGSGVSRAAAIPTGWEIVVDLIQKVAAVRGEACVPDPEIWFRNTFGGDPNYTDLLKRLARTQAERQQLLRDYFEPSSEDPAAPARQPTRTHHAVAALVKSGHVRVIVTTNFDRLMERALDAVGVSPAVISTPSGVDGALPITHAPCTLLKLHGDYLDARIKNTPEELSKYDRRFSRLLDRILDEFGIIVSGWSADWDEALRDAFERCKSRRFTTYWTCRGEPSDAAKRIARARAAELVSIRDADQFFGDLLQKVQALAAFSPPHPLSAKTAVATIKRLLSDERHRIELHDFVAREVERVMEATTDERLPVSAVLPVPEIRSRMKQYETLTSTLRDLFVTACYWGNTAQHEVIVRAIERLANRPSTGGSTLLIGLRQYPALIVFYAGGISATARRNYAMLRALLLEPRVGDDSTGNREGQARAVEQLHPMKLLDQGAGREVLEGKERHKTPFSDYLFEYLRQPLWEVLPDNERYESEFDRFEYLLAIVAASLPENREWVWVPPGRFSWKGGFRGGVPPIVTELKQEALAQGSEWGPIKSGLIPSIESVSDAEKKALEMAARMTRL